MNVTNSVQNLVLKMNIMYILHVDNVEISVLHFLQCNIFNSSMYNDITLCRNFVLMVPHIGKVTSIQNSLNSF